MASPNLIDALKLSESELMKKKTKVLRGNTAKNVLARVSKVEPKKKPRSQAEKRKAMYGSKE